MNQRLPGQFYVRMQTSFTILFFLVTAQMCFPMSADTFTDGTHTAKLLTAAEQVDGVKRYTMSTTAPLRDNQPADKARTFIELPGVPIIRTGNEMFDALYALTLDDAKLNAVDQIRDGSFDVRDTMNRPFFQTGQKWTYVWTRDISYSVDLGLASLDPQRCVNSLLFKTTCLKSGIPGSYSRQIVQDTGSGGSYPVSTDRVVWAIGAWKALKCLDGQSRQTFLDDAWQIMHDTIEHDRCVIFDPDDGLYRGEQSFLDWREQTYPGWTRDNVLAIAQAKALSTNIGHYQLLKTAAELAGLKGQAELETKYQRWANALKKAINTEFYIESKGLYSSLILDEPDRIRLNRFDLLGQSLAVLCGIADQTQSEKIIANYPQGRYGPPVVWPQEQTVPIYHNQAIWPFVTAYWLKAAKQVGNASAVDQAVFSLVRGTALNLSNMENFDFATGNAYAESNGISGPVINSQRQLWSVAGYMAMVQDVIFGLETDFDGIRFLPCITGKMHSDYFKNSDTINLKNFIYRGKTIHVTIDLPEVSNSESGIYTIDAITLNGQSIGRRFNSFKNLKDDNHWDIKLSCSGKNASDRIHLVENLSGCHIFGPKQPQWNTEPITVENGKLKLHFDAAGKTDVHFNIYRNGQLQAKELTESDWTDPDSANYQDNTYFYRIEAVYPETGNCSHLSPAKFLCPKENTIEITAAAMKNKGGNLVNSHHFENWGQPDHELMIPSFTVNKSGRYKVNTDYSNGAGPINTGITCAVKRIEISELTGDKICKAFLIMPHTADWQRYLNSTSFQVDLKAGTQYSIKVFEDTYARNMSYFDHYEPYKSTGNGTGSYNYVNISKIRLTLCNAIN